MFKTIAILITGFSLLALNARAADTNRPSLLSTGSSEKSYVLGPNDTIDLKVTQEDDFTAHKKISKEGTVEIPMLGTVHLAGKTVEEARAMIRDALRADYLVHPEVSLTIGEYAKRRYTILGQISKPGIYEFSGDETITLLQAIGKAGGISRLGDLKKITIQRLTADGKMLPFSVNAEKLQKDKSSKPIEIMPDDTITIGERLF